MTRTVCRNDRSTVIAIDTSAIFAIVLGEPESQACMVALAAETRILISAGSVVECLVVAARRDLVDETNMLLDELGLEVVTVTPAAARRIGDAYQRWGKNMHSAGLNFGDCFAYEVAKHHGCALLYVGGDFAKTDLASVL